MHREEHSMDRCWCRAELSESFGGHWSISISGEIRMDQWPFALFWSFRESRMDQWRWKFVKKFPPRVALVHGWLFPDARQNRRNFYFILTASMFRSLGTTPISGKTLSERKGHSRSSGRVPGYSRSSSRNWKFHSRNTKFHSRNGLSRLDQYETHNSRSNSRSDSRNCREPTRKTFICPIHSRSVFSRIGVVPANKKCGVK